MYIKKSFVKLDSNGKPFVDVPDHYKLSSIEMNAEIFNYLNPISYCRSLLAFKHPMKGGGPDIPTIITSIGFQELDKNWCCDLTNTAAKSRGVPIRVGLQKIGFNEIIGVISTSHHNMHGTPKPSWMNPFESPVIHWIDAEIFGSSEANDWTSLWTSNTYVHLPIAVTPIYVRLFPWVNGSVDPSCIAGVLCSAYIVSSVPALAMWLRTCLPLNARDFTTFNCRLSVRQGITFDTLLRHLPSATFISDCLQSTLNQMTQDGYDNFYIGVTEVYPVILDVKALKKKYFKWSASDFLCTGSDTIVAHGYNFSEPGGSIQSLIKSYYVDINPVSIRGNIHNQV